MVPENMGTVTDKNVTLVQNRYSLREKKVMSFTAIIVPCSAINTTINLSK